MEVLQVAWMAAAVVMEVREAALPGRGTAVEKEGVH